MLYIGFLVGLFLYREDGGGMFLPKRLLTFEGNTGFYVPEYRTVHKHR
jgi:hypothetical protein